MKKQVLVVGLGQFGMTLARSLSRRGAEVLAIDIREDLVHDAAEFTAEALCLDAIDEDELGKAAPARRDACICAIGDESREASIICTALLRQMGAPRIIARANDVVHERILKLVGAHQIVNPEREFGERLATLVVHEGILGELPLGNDLVITELRMPESFHGKSLLDLGLPKRFGLTVIAIRRPGHETAILPNPKEPLPEDGILVVVSRGGSVERLLERI